MVWYRSRYVQFLEAEVARLQEREKRLLNTCLPRLGYEPLDQPEKKPASAPKRRLSMQQWAKDQMKKALGVERVFSDGIPRPDRKEQDGDTAKRA